MTNLCIFVATLVAVAYAKDACYNINELAEKAKPLREGCKTETKAKNEKDKAACFMSFKICHLTKLGVMNSAGNGVDHEKLVSILVKMANKDKTDAIKADVEPCGALKMDNIDKISPYFDCIEEKLSKDCPELSTHRKQFRDEFEGSATNIC